MNNQIVLGFFEGIILAVGFAHISLSSDKHLNVIPVAVLLLIVGLMDKLGAYFLKIPFGFGSETENKNTTVLATLLFGYLLLKNL